MDKRVPKFKSMQELYQRLTPALKLKVEEVKRLKLNIEEQDVWNYLMQNVWSNKKDIRIHEMVDDILNLDSLKLEIYLKKLRNE